MTQTLVNKRDIDFNLYEVLDAEALTQQDYYSDHSRETFTMALDAADQLAQELFWPKYQEFDQQECRLENGQAIVPAGLQEIWDALRDGGWFGAAGDYDMDGQQFPAVIHLACSMMFNAANTTATMYMGLTNGAAHLLHSFASDDLIEKNFRPMYAGKFGGTMCLTEPQAGTSLGDIETTATKVDGEDYYLICGTKRFISSGDHNLAPNIIHPVLAKIDGAPAGVKGISLFIVPKFRLNDDGSVGDSNDVITAGLEHKLGLKGQATAELKLGENDNCRGYLVGEENNGLKYMFKMMNGARIHTGLQATSLASTAYHCALQYTKEREQGRSITKQDASTPQIPIIQHPEIRRLLLKQKAFIEGSLALLMYCSKQQDIIQTTQSKDDEACQKATSILEMLTPVCKAYSSEVGCESISIAMQCTGGAGYIEEYPFAQFFRDSRIFPIYEGTNQIQALDLLSRKIPAKNGTDLQTVMAEIGVTLEEAKQQEELKPLAENLNTALNSVAETTMHLGALGLSGKVELYISHASPYLTAFSQLIVAWRFLAQAIIANTEIKNGSDDLFYKSKLETARYYINAILPSTNTICRGIKDNADTALEFHEDWF